MKLIFQPIQSKDFEDVISMFQAAARKINKMNIDHWQYWKNPPLEKLNWVKDGIANQEYHFIKNADQQVIGMVRILMEDLMYWGEQDEKAKYVHSLVVKEEFNGQGLGKKILQQIAQHVQTEDCKYLRLDADSKNPKLCSYYEKQGFQKVGTKELPISVYNLYQKELI